MQGDRYRAGVPGCLHKVNRMNKTIKTLLRAMEMASGLERVGEGIVGPSSNKKLFPVHRPGGLKGAYWNFFFFFSYFHFF